MVTGNFVFYLLYWGLGGEFEENCHITPFMFFWLKKNVYLKKKC